MRKCTCGHFQNEHSWIGENNIDHLEGYHFTGKFISTKVEGKGICKKCTCPEYKGQSRFRPKHTKYPERETSNNDAEKRCTRCGRLLSNHVGIDHQFQDKR